jgi:hypothetical protein
VIDASRTLTLVSPPANDPAPIDHLQILLCEPGHAATKTHRADGTTQAFELGWLFEHASVPITSLDDLFDSLSRLAPNPRAVVIRGCVRPGAPRAIRRKFKERQNGPSVHVDECARKWVCLDLDKGGPVVGERAGARDYRAAVLEWLNSSLPECFRGVRCVIQLSASAHKSPTLKCHAWFLLDRLASDKELRALAKEWGLDPSLYNAVQPHYIANPIFEGMADPITERIWMVHGDRDLVTLPTSKGHIALREFADDMVRRECRKINDMVYRGAGRHPVFNEAAFRLGQLCPHWLSETLVLQTLAGVAQMIHKQRNDLIDGPRLAELIDPAEGDIARGIRDGMAAPKFAGGDGWLGSLEYTKEGTPRGSLRNAMIVARCDPAFDGVLAYDKREGPMFRQRGPWVRTVPTQALADDDGLKFLDYLSERHGIRCDDWRKCLTALASVSRDDTFDSWCEYLEECALDWDGTPRIATLAKDVLGCVHPYECEVLERGLIATVRRAYEPGCKSDYMVALFEERGGVGKTTFLIWLGGHYYAALADRAGDKDLTLAAHRCAVADLSEMSAIRKSDVNQVKSWLTTQEDLVRPPYGVAHIRMPRQFQQWSSFNGKIDDPLFEDSAMGRRVRPIRVGKIRMDLFTEDLRKQVWGETMHRYWAGACSWRLSAENDAALAAAVGKQTVSDSVENDPWFFMVEEWLSRSVNTQKVTLNAVAEGAIQIAKERIDSKVVRKLARILRALGWEPEHGRGGNAWVHRVHEGSP